MKSVIKVPRSLNSTVFIHPEPVFFFKGETFGKGDFQQLSCMHTLTPSELQQEDMFKQDWLKTKPPKHKSLPVIYIHQNYIS